MSHPAKKLLLLSIVVFVLAAPACAMTPGGPVSLEGLEPVSVDGELNEGRSVKGEILNIGEVIFTQGVGTGVPAEVVYPVPDGAGRFEAWVGFDITSTDGSGRFRVYADGELKFDSGEKTFHAYRRGGGPAVNPDRPMKVTVPVDGASRLTLEVTREGEGEVYANWADARFVPADWPEYRSRGPAESEISATPPMGWNSWNAVGKDLDQEIVHGVAEALVETGLREAGYVYLCLDDGWEGDLPHDEQGNPRVNTDKFPDGLKALGDYLHGKGLKFGIYATPDFVGGSRREGIWTGGNEWRWVRAFQQWGVDYLKYDFSDKASNALMANALARSERPIFYNVCEWGHSAPWEWAYHFGGDSWRISYDVMDRWETGVDQNPVGIVDAVDQSEGLGRFSGPGHWNDLDMLVIGLSGGTWAERERRKEKLDAASKIEHRSQMSLWCLMASPLIIGSDVRKLDDFSLETLLNEEAIAIDQDPLGVPAWRAVKLDDVEVWKRPLKGGDIALGLLNRGADTMEITADWREVSLEGKYEVRDLWAHEDLGVYEGEITRTVRSHETVLLRLSPVDR